MTSYSAACSTIIVDASFVIRALLPVGENTKTLDFFTHWRGEGIDICAPDLMLTEAVSVIRQAMYRKWIIEKEARLAVEDLFQLDVRIIPSDLELCLSALMWAGQLGQSKAYDGFYLAVAERMRGEFWTGDQRLAKRANQLSLAWVNMVNS